METTKVSEKGGFYWRGLSLRRTRPCALLRSLPSLRQGHGCNPSPADARRSKDAPACRRDADSGSVCPANEPSHTSAAHQRVLTVEDLGLHFPSLAVPRCDDRGVAYRVDGDDLFVGDEVGQDSDGLA